MANEYVSPTSYSDPDNSWKDEINAYDGNIQTAAAGRVYPYSWCNYLILTIDAIYCSKVKFVAGYDGTGGINSIDLDVYYEDAWHDVFEGSFLGRVWVEKSLGAIHYVTKMRFRFFNSGSVGKVAALGEAMFYEAVSIPKVTTNAATGVSGALATLNGNITDTGGATCTVRGFKYKEGVGGGEQDVSDSGAFGTGVFSEALTGLDDTKKYYFKAYATNSEGTGEGEWLSFGVTVAAPTVTSGAATSVDHEKATLNGNITATGGQDCTERGFQWKIGAGGDVETLPETGTFGVGAYTLDLENLDSNVQYYFRAYAKNGGGTSYGDWLNFTTNYTTPEVTTHNATDELITQVTGNGEIVSTGGKDCEERGFEYGLSKVATWEKKDTAGGYGVGFFTKTIDGLSANTEYWYRAYAKFVSEEENIQRTTSSYHKNQLQLQVYGDKIYYVWSESDGSYNQIWTGILNIDGSVWEATKRTTSSTHKTKPQLFVTSSKIYYVWEEGTTPDHPKEIWTAIMDLDQTGWIATQREVNTEDTFEPQLQVVSDTIYYVWRESDGTYYQIWTATMTTAGADWTATKRTTSAYTKISPQFQVLGSTIYFVWVESLGAYYQIWTATMTTAGADWTATKQTDDNNTKSDPQFQVEVTKIYYVYACIYEAYKQLYVATTNLDGTDWSTTRKTDYGVYGVVSHPQIQVLNDKIYYTYQVYKTTYTRTMIYGARMKTDGTEWSELQLTSNDYDSQYPQFQVTGEDVIYYSWLKLNSKRQIWTSTSNPCIGYGEWVKFITAAPGLPGAKPSGYKNDVCSDQSGHSYILNRSLTDDGATYQSFFVLSTDLSGKKTLHTNKRLLDIFSYFINKGSGTAKIYVKRDTEPNWQYAGEVSLSGEEEIIIRHLPSENEDTEGDVDFLAKTFLIKFVFENDFEFIGMITEAVPIGDR